jgi:hypothetical protein
MNRDWAKGGSGGTRAARGPASRSRAIALTYGKVRYTVNY